MVIAVQRQRGGQVDHGRIRHALCQQRGKLCRIIGRVAVLPGQEGVFIRDDGRKDLRIGPGQIAVVDELKPVGCVLHGGFVDGRVELRRIAVGHIDAVIVLFLQHVQERHGFEPPEAVPQRELVERVGLKFRHELAAQDR